MGAWPSGISAITLFVEDLVATKDFYQEVFGLPLHYEDEASAVFNFGNTLINLLKVEEAPDLIATGAGRVTRGRLAVPVHDRCR